MRRAAVIAIFIFRTLGAQTIADFEEEYRLMTEREGFRGNPVAIERDWAKAESVPDPFPETPYVSQMEREEAQLRRAYSFYESAREIASELRQQLDAKPGRSIRDPLWWKELDESAAESRRQRALRQRFAIDLAERYHRVFESLQELDRTAFRQDKRVISLKRMAYRQYIILQSAVGNYIPAIEVLDEYARLEGAQTEWPLHYYYYVCLAGVFRDLKRSSAVREEVLRSVRLRKNIHWRRAVELKFTKDSAEFDEVSRRIRSDLRDPPRSPIRPYSSGRSL
jgi:hypothetical protein